MTSIMVETSENFADRLGKLSKKHERMTHGYTTKIGKDGLLVVTPKKRRVVPGGTGVKVFLMVVVCFIGFKTFTLAAVGPVTYNERLSKLENGSMIEKAGAKAMAIDPVTEALATSVGPVLR